MFKLPDVEGYIKEALSTTKAILDELKAIRSVLEDISDLQRAPFLDIKEEGYEPLLDPRDGWPTSGTHVNWVMTKDDTSTTWNGEDTNLTNKEFIQDYYNRIDER